MGYYKNLVEKEVRPPRKEISLLGEKYVFPNHVYLYLEKNFKMIHDEYYIKGINGGTFFKCLGSYDNSTIYMKGKPLYIIKNSNSTSKICSATGKTELCKITSKISLKAVKYKATFFNTSTQQEIVLSMNADDVYRACGIFSGREGDGAPLVCKILRTNKTKIESNHSDTRYLIEIAPNTDNLFMIMLAIIFAKRAQRAFEFKKKKVIYTA